MATVIGRSGAWHSIAAAVASRGFQVSAPWEIPLLLARLEDSRPQLIAAHRESTLQAVGLLEARIAELLSRRGFFRRLIGAFKVRALKREISELHGVDGSYASSLDASALHVRSILHSAELVGAEAELEVIELLRSLPSPAVVFNDVRLRANRPIRFNGAALVSAQVDHVVLTPSGVFVIETKRWGRGFVESGKYFNPFEQVRRANYLCYDLLKESIGKTKVRSIIASHGSLPEPPPDSYAKVLRPEQLPGYISAFRAEEMLPFQFDEVHRFFQSRVANPGAG